MASIKITALSDIGSNISYSTLVPVVDMSSAPVTDKANLQIVGNLILDGAGGTYFAAAAKATLAATVTTNAQPNITSVGTLTSLTITNTASAGNLSTSGTLGVSGNANVGNLGTDGQIIATGNITGSNIISTNNVFSNNVISNTSLRLAGYADDFARDAAIPVPQIGMMVFNQTGNFFQGYDGTTWVNLN